MKRVAFLAVFAALAASGSASAAPVGFLRARPLELAASYVARKPVVVWCAKNTAAWHSFMLRTYDVDNGAHGSTRPGSGETRLAPEVCAPLLSQLLGDTVWYPTLAFAVEVVTHESIHARGTSNEGITDCAAVHEMPRVAVVYFHVKAGKQLRALMAEAWAWRAQAAPAYRTVC